MEIRVRELLAFIKANPRLEEYDSPICISLPTTIIDQPKNHVEIELKGISLGNDGRLSLCIDVDTDAKLCDNCEIAKDAAEKAADAVRAMEITIGEAKVAVDKLLQK